MPANHCILHTPEARAKMSAALSGKPKPHKRRRVLMIEGVQHFGCCRCKRFYKREQFYAEPRTFYGLKSECKSCHGKTNMESRNQELHLKGRRESMARQRAIDPEKFRARERKRPRRHGIKVDARMIIYLALRIGAIARPELCSGCGEKKKLTAHHHDYMNPLDVEWLCYLCHAQRHRKVVL